MIQKAEPSVRTAEKLEALNRFPIRSWAEAIELLGDAILLERLILAGAWGAVDRLVDEMAGKRGVGE